MRIKKQGVLQYLTHRFLFVWFLTLKMLEIISSISTYNVVWAGVWDQRRRDLYFLRLFISSFSPPLPYPSFPVRLRGGFWKKQREIWKLNVNECLFDKNEISRTCCLSQILQHCGCELMILRETFVNEIWEVKGLVLTSACWEIFQLQKYFVLFSKKTGGLDIISSHGNIWMRFWKTTCSGVGHEQTDLSNHSYLELFMNIS